jgi:hypothetical protein
MAYGLGLRPVGGGLGFLVLTNCHCLGRHAASYDDSGAIPKRQEHYSLRCLEAMHCLERNRGGWRE